MQPSFTELKPKIILGVVAHPDDLDFCCAGSLARWAAEGAEIYYLILTDGSKGSEDRTLTPAELTKTRRQEQRDAAKLIGVKDVFFLDHEDGQLVVTSELKGQIVRVIRQIKPDVVVTMDPTVSYVSELGIINHPDHRAAGQAALDAVFPLARDHLSFPEILAEGLEPHKTATMLLVNFGRSNYYVDITNHLEQKFQAMDAHVSQVPADTSGMHTALQQMAERAGTAAGCKYAEGFIRIDIN